MMNFDVLFDSELDSARHCYMRARVLRDVLKNPKVIDALVYQLDVQGKPAVLARLSSDEKLKLIARQVEHFRTFPTSKWYGVPEKEIVAASIFRSEKLSDRFVRGDVFCAVRAEADLASPVVRWLEQKGLSAHLEIPLGVGRVDVLGHRPSKLLGLVDPRSVAVELKNDYSQLKRALDQIVTFGDYAHEIWIACTPALAADYLDRHAEARGVKHWDPDVFTRKLTSVGAGLLLVERDAVYEVLKPKDRTPESKRLKEVAELIEDARRA